MTKQSWHFTQPHQLSLFLQITELRHGTFLIHKPTEDFPGQSFRKGNSQMFPTNNYVCIIGQFSQDIKHSYGPLFIRDMALSTKEQSAHNISSHTWLLSLRYVGRLVKICCVSHIPTQAGILALKKKKQKPKTKKQTFHFGAPLQTDSHLHYTEVNPEQLHCCWM